MYTGRQCRGLIPTRCRRVLTLCTSPTFPIPTRLLLVPANGAGSRLIWPSNLTTGHGALDIDRNQWAGTDGLPPPAPPKVEKDEKKKER